MCGKITIEPAEIVQISADGTVTTSFRSPRRPAFVPTALAVNFCPLPLGVQRLHDLRSACRVAPSCTRSQGAKALSESGKQDLGRSRSTRHNAALAAFNSYSIPKASKASEIACSSAFRTPGSSFRISRSRWSGLSARSPGAGPSTA